MHYYYLLTMCKLLLDNVLATLNCTDLVSCDAIFQERKLHKSLKEQA